MGVSIVGPGARALNDPRDHAAMTSQIMAPARRLGDHRPLRRPDAEP
jgi:hypothetical protein